MNRTLRLLTVILVLFVFSQVSYAEDHMLGKQDGGFGLLVCETESASEFQLIDNNGQQIGSKWPFIGEVNDGYVIISDGQQCGIMDTKGNITVAPEYIYIRYMSDSTFCAYNDEEIVLITGSGKTIASYPGSVPQIIYEDYVIFECLVSGTGLLSKDGKLLMEPVWDSVSIPCCGIIRASSEDECYYFDDLGNIVFKGKAGMDFHDDVAIVMNDQDQLMIVDKSGKILYTSSGEKGFYGEFYDGLCVAVDSGTGKYGYIGKDGQWVVQPIYDMAYDFYDGYGTIELSNKCGLINPAGEVVIDCQYDTLFIGEEGLISVKKGNSFGVINIQNEMICPMIWDKIGVFEEGYCPVQKDNSWGFVDQNGNAIIPCQYLLVNYFKNGRTVVVDFNQRSWLIDAQGTIIAPVLN